MFFKPDVPKAITPLGGKNRGSALPEIWELRVSCNAECRVGDVCGVFTREDRTFLHLSSAEKFGCCKHLWKFAHDKFDCGIRFDTIRCRGSRVLEERFVGAIETICEDDKENSVAKVAPHIMYVHEQEDFRNPQEIDSLDEKKFETEIQKIFDRAEALIAE